MNLRSRLLIMGCLAIVIQLLIMSIIFGYLFYPKILNLEKSLVEKNLHRGLEILQREQFHLEHLARVLAQSPFIEGLAGESSSQSPKNEILQDKMRNLEINLLYVLNNNNQVAWSKIYDLTADKAYPNQPFLTQLFEKQPKLFEHFSSANLQGGLYTSALGPMLVVSAPISSLTSGKIEGTLILGKLITQDVIHLIQSLSYTDIELFPFGTSPLTTEQLEIIQRLLQSNSDILTKENNHLMRGYMVLQDLTQQPNLLMFTTQAQDFMKEIEIDYLQLVIILLSLQILFFLLLFLMLRQTFLIPTKKLIEQINKTDDEWENPLHGIKPWHEIGMLENSISNFMARQESRQRQEESLAYREKTQQISLRFYQEIDESLTPLIEGLQSAEKKLSNLPVNDLEWIIAEAKTGQISVNQISEYTRKLSVINEKLRHYQKETRRQVFELYSKALRNAAALRAKAKRLAPFRQLTSHFGFQDKNRTPMARS